MRVVNGYPPNYKDIVATLHPTANTVFTYGNTVYAPGHDWIDNALAVHEGVHSQRQEEGVGPLKWWELYLQDPQFRLTEELVAYRAQYKYFCKQVKAKKVRRAFLEAIAKDLSGPMYGGLMTFDRAKAEIRT
jgi:hypothetical protein